MAVTSISLNISDEETITAKNGTLAVAEGKYATLENGKVPSEELPSYVDDVLDYDSRDDFPADGESGKIYIADDDNTVWRWTGGDYIQIDSSVGSADVAARLGTSTVGGAAQGVYLSNGYPEAMSATVGSSTKPAYLNAGTVAVCGDSLDASITGNAATADSAATAASADKATEADHAASADSATTAETAASATSADKLTCGDVGGESSPVYFKDGVPAACTEIEANPYAGVDAGSEVNPVYVDNGEIKGSTATVGGASEPVYLKAGEITACEGIATDGDIESAISDLTLTGSLSTAGVLTITLE